MAYLALSTANLPNPAIDPAQGASPADYFDIDTYTGTGATHERSNFTFQPDWLWIKRRSTADNHTSWDSVRGVNKVLKPNEAGAEGTDATQISSFDADGFTISGGDVNASGQTFVAWCWKANGSGVSNNAGTIPSTVSANTTSGFSVVTFTSNGSSGQTIGHGLGVAPKMVIAKNRSSSGNWWVYNYNIGNANYMELNTTIASTGGANVWSSTHPSSTVVYSGLNSLAPTSGHEVVMYCFAEVEGFSKIGSYVANNSTDGPFLYCGFRPAFLMVKRANNAGAPWSIIDNTRNTYNQVNLEIDANSSAAEFNINNGADFVSNGVKLRDSAYLNSSNGNTFIYMAFAEQPFKYSNAR